MSVLVSVSTLFQQVGTRPGGLYDMRPPRQIQTTWSTSAG